ncbi:MULTISPECIES: hypothetical protein [Cyanophyceae]|nr:MULTISPECIES: hypothetical protein [unclassified Trichocoleus]
MSCGKIYKSDQQVALAYIRFAIAPSSKSSRERSHSQEENAIAL